MVMEQSCGDEAINVYDAIVIGGGIIGSCTTYELSKRGFKTLLLEQYDFLHHLGSSHGASRTLRTTYPEPYYPPMVFHAITQWRKAEEEAGFSVYTQTPHLDMGPSNNSTLQYLLSVCRNSDHQILTSAELADKFGGVFTVPDDWIAVVTPDGGVIKPTKAVFMFQALAMRRGAVLKDNVVVESVERRPDGILAVRCSGSSRSSCSDYSTRKVVVATGAWSGKLLQAFFGVGIPMQPLHTTIAYWKLKEAEEPKFRHENGFPTFACYDDPYIYGTPACDFPGTIKIGIHGGHACDPDKREWTTDREWLRKNASVWIKDRFGGAVEAEEVAAMQGCMYAMMPDEDFVIDFAGGEDWGKDVVVACGFSGHGFKMGPVVGSIVADLVVHGECRLNGVDLDHFKIDRFKGGGDDDHKDSDVIRAGNAKEYGSQVHLSSPSLLI